MYLGQELKTMKYDAPADQDQFVEYLRHRKIDEVML